MAAHLRLSWRGLLILLLVSGLLTLVGGGAWLAVRHFTAEHHLKAAREAMTQHRLERARSHLDQVLASRPQSPEPHLLAARVARQLDHPEEARRLLERCRKLQGGDSEATQLEDLMQRAQFGDLESVFSLLWSYVEQDTPQAPLVLEALTLGFIHNTQLPQAYMCLDRWLKLAPDNPQALFCKAWCFHRRGLIPHAKDWYARSLEQDPESDNVRVRYGQVLRELNRYKEAEEQFRIVLGHQPDFPEATVDLAACLRGRGQLAEARQQLEAHLEIHPEDASALAELGGIALDEGDVAGAERLLHRALARDRSLMAARFALVTCLRRLGRGKEADQERAIYERLSKESERMQAILNTELPKRLRDVGLYYEMATLLFRRGQKLAGSQWLLNALKLDPNHQPSHALLASYYEEAGYPDLAREHRQRAGPPAGTSASPPGKAASTRLPAP